MKPQRSLPDGFYRTTLVIGLGFFTMGLMDPLYDAFVPVFLRQYQSSLAVIGFIMTIDNIFAVFLIPIVAAWSDRVQTRIGRRMPFIVVTLPITAMLFAVIPTAAARGFIALVLLLFVFNIFKQAARGPVVALMPDTIPGEFRSEANGVINLMGGVAAIVGTVVLGPMMAISIVLPIIGDTARRLPFLLSAVLVLVATITLFLFVKERKARLSAGSAAGDPETEDAARPPILESLRTVFRAPESSARLVLLSLLAWFIGYQGVLPFLTLYSIEILGVSEGLAALSPGAVAIAYALFAVPAGILARKRGRKTVIRRALLVLVVILLALFSLGGVVRLLGLSGGLKLGLFWGLLFLFGMAWVTVITNSFPMLWQMATFGTMGIYTGLYYFFSQTAAIVSPPITGLIIDAAGYPGIFFFAALCMGAAWVLMGKVQRGEAHE